MPRQGSNIKKTSTGRWSLRFKLKETVIGDDGQPKTVWRDKERTFDTRADAEDFQAEIRLTASRGEVWRDQREIPVATLGQLVDGYLAASSTAAAATQRKHKSLLKSWRQWAGEDTPVTSLSASLLERYAASLPGEGRKAVTRHRKVLLVEQMWKWGRRRLDLYPGLPEFSQVTGDDASSVRHPPPVVRLAAPTWADVDAMIRAIRNGHKHGTANKRIALVLRYTGLRVAQVLGLRWEDLRLDYPAGPYLVVRAGREGSKLSAGRAVPLHPELVKLLRSWGPRPSGLVFDVEDAGPFWKAGHTTRRALTTAWRAAGVDEAKWGVSESERASGGRSHASPCHAIRACVKVELLRARVSESVVDYFIGHSKGSTSLAYVPEAAPETSPLWELLVEAVDKIPPHQFEVG